MTLNLKHRGWGKRHRFCRSVGERAVLDHLRFMQPLQLTRLTREIKV